MVTRIHAFGPNGELSPGAAAALAEHGGVEVVSGTVTLDGSGPPVRQFYCTASATIEGVAFAAGTAVVFRRTPAGVWGYIIVDPWTDTSATTTTTTTAAATTTTTTTSSTTTTTTTSSILTFFTDFSEYTSGSPPSDWSVQAGSFDTYEVTTGAGVDSSNGLRLSTSANALGAVIWDDVPSADDVEVVIRFKPDSVNANSVLPARFSGTSTATQTGYYVYHSTSALELRVRVDGASGTVLGTSSTVSADTWHWVRLRLNGSTISYRAWADGASEPAAWDASVTDTTITAAGLIALGHFAAIDTNVFDRIGIAIGGGTAPTVGEEV